MAINKKTNFCKENFEETSKVSEVIALPVVQLKFLPYQRGQSKGKQLISQEYGQDGLPNKTHLYRHFRGTLMNGLKQPVCKAPAPITVILGNYIPKTIVALLCSGI